GIEEIARAIYFSHEELDFDRIRDYALRMGNLTIMKRLGYILERTGLLERYGRIFEGLRLPSGYTALDTLSPRKGRYDSRWMLLVNREIDPEGWSY
ncbi:transcriptional regulator, partial [Candidatus Poribacteria bacterium]